jgi:hypothetical protein
VPNTLRSRVNQASLPLMTKLASLPKAMPFLLMVVLLVGGLLIPDPFGLVLRSLAALFVAWVLYLSWPRLTPTERIMRFAVLMLAAALAVVGLP